MFKQGLLRLSLFLLWTPGFIDGSEVTQDSILWKNKGDNATIHCSHTKGLQYYQMYWYRQLPGETMKLKLICITYNMQKKGLRCNSCWFTTKLKHERVKSAYCAVLSTEQLHCDSGTSEAYFGGGTKLTVLEYDVKPPVVKVLGPSSRECRNLKDNERRKTLLCVASDFYPDHVSVSWRVGGQEVSRGVATDNAALRQGENYKITSRLRVSAEDWFKPETEFECIVSFFDGTGNTNHSASIFGGKGLFTWNLRNKQNLFM
uniref:Ig-like domain-containing protein n=1 Tax=Scophthalmus maximus TaxID=52904 RepID=A0A8D3DP03_SCOMX